MKSIRCNFLSITRRYRHKNILERNRVFYDIHKGERCFIIANGPSVNSQNLHFLKDEICFVVNFFYLHDDYNVINPRYYCMTHSHGMAESHYDVVIESLVKHTSQDTTFFFPLIDMQRCTRNNMFENRKAYFVNFCNMPFKYLKSKEIDLTHGVPNFQSVSIMALEIAMYMGFSEIYLIGYDHDWILNNARNDYHCYDEEKKRILHKDNSFAVNESDEVTGQCTFEENLKANLRLWAQYRSLKNMADFKGIKIYNATKGGLLDVFPRVEYEKLFGR